MHKHLKKLSLLVVALMLLAPAAVSYAQPCPTGSSESSSNCVSEQFMGSGGSVDGTSGTRDAVGDAGVGPSGNGINEIDSGYVTDGEPRLIFIVNSSSVSFGTLSTLTTATATSTFSVLDYTSYGYVVQTFGSTPTSGSSDIDGMSVTDLPQAGVEQYGINLRANTVPVAFGADPVQVPDSSFSSGGAAGGYSTANNFRYVAGETIASAAASSGQTDFTVSYIVNISSTTGGGNYRGVQGFICTATY